MLRSAAWIAIFAMVALASAHADQPHPSAPAKKSHPVSQRDRDRARQDFLDGAKFLIARQPRRALDAFTLASALDPGNRRYIVSEKIAREHLVMALVQQSEKQRILGHLTASRNTLLQAARIDPANAMVREHIWELASSSLDGQPAMRVRNTLAAPVVLQPQPGNRTFHLDTSERDLIDHVLTAYGIHPTLDASVGSRMIRFNLENVDFGQASQALSLATGTFLVPLDPRRALVAKDSRANRTNFQRVAAETLYLPGMSSEELTDMVSLTKNIFGIQQAQVAGNQSALSVRAPVGDLTALNTTLRNLIDSRGIVQLDVSMYDVSRTKATNLGILLPNQTSVFNVYSEARNILNSNSSLVQQIISSGLAAPGDWQAILAILIASGQISNSILNQPFGIIGGGLTMTGITSSGGFANMKLNSSNVRAVDQVQLRVLDRAQGTIRSGERYPIETSSYSNLSPNSLSIPGISTAGLSSTLQNLGVSLASLESAATQAIPQVQYQNIGLTLDVTPHIQGRSHVSLKLTFKLTALAGSSINGLPILDSRLYQAIDTLASGQSTVLVSTLTRSESNAITGIPGLSEIPGFANTTNNKSNLSYSRLAIVITPHIVRMPAKTAEEMVMLPRGQQQP
jgi:Flp pilus assembly secretin CpaC